MYKRRAASFLAGFLLLFVWGWTSNLSARTVPRQVVITEAKNGNTVTVYKGQELVIELEANPSTGYGWQIKEVDKTLLKPREIEFQKSGYGCNLLGAPQKQRLSFEVIGLGKGTIELVYQRPWEQRPINHYSVNINVPGEAHIEPVASTKETKKGQTTAEKRFAIFELTEEGPKIHFEPEIKIKPVPKEKLQDLKLTTTIMTEDFEWNFPGTKWKVSGNPTWNETNYRAYSGSQSCYCAARGSRQVDPPGPYRNNMSAWMTYGPFDLSDARDAKLFFKYWTKIEYGHDAFFVGASVTGNKFYCESYRGNWGEWCTDYFDLTNVPLLGNLCGYRKVWIAFGFLSDKSITFEGVYLDDISLQKEIGAESLPASFDWREKEGVTPIKNQGDCGSCWAFSTVAPLEANIKIKDGLTVDLSEQFLLSCNTDGWNCKGGLFAHDYHWNKATDAGEAGAVLESEKPYVAKYKRCCSSSTPCPFSHLYKLSSWSCIGEWAPRPSCDTGQINDIRKIKKAIMYYGPISTAVCAGSSFQRYKRGVFEKDECYEANHGVVLVGWDDNQGTNGVWFLRNSWGRKWGEHGYMRIGYGISGIGQCSNYIVYKPVAMPWLPLLLGD